MSRQRLSAIEIAEGALLADVVVIFQVIWMYIPVVGVFFRILIPVVFTILVLRRNLYAAIMSLCVAVFLASVVTGPNIIDLIYLALEGIGGLFLGVTMRYRARDSIIILLGTTGLGVSIYALFFFIAALLGTPLNEIIASFHRTYTHAVAAANFSAGQVGLGGLWQHTLFPPINQFVEWAFTYWAALFFAYNWLTALPVMLVMYYVTNSLVRLLGYEVRPFPGGWVHRLLRRIDRRLLRVALKRQSRRGRRAGEHTADEQSQRPDREEVGV
jgi:uncharacterized protein YybS (DUF2232 family)